MSRIVHTSLVAGNGKEARLVGGYGAWLELEDGRKLLDASNTGGPLGHRHPAMVEAVRRAAELPVINEGWVWAERERAAEELINMAFAGEDWVGGVRFCLSGSEANDLALSFSQAFTGRNALATRERAYHGLAGLARSLTVQPQWHGGLSVLNNASRPAPSPFPVRQLPAPVHARYGGEQQNSSQEDRLSIARTAEMLADVAVTAIDYSQGGIYYDPEYQDAVAKAARQAGSLWLADEVVTGLGRSGRWFAFQGGNERPDLVTLGKPLAGGASPAGAIVFSKDILDELKDKSWRTYSTFRGHPLTMTCIRAHLRAVQEENLLERVQRLETIVDRRMGELFKKHPSVARINGHGLHWTVELHGPDWRDFTANTNEMPLATKVVRRAAEAGAMIATSGEQTSIFLAPPLIVSEDEIGQILDALDAGLEISDALYEG